MYNFSKFDYRRVVIIAGKTFARLRGFGGRLAAGIVLVLIAGYVSLPWWAPTGYIRRHVAEQLSQQMGTAVSIESLSLSWSEGIDLRGLRVGDAGEAIVAIERIKADFSPFDMFVLNHLEWMELEGMSLNINIGGDGDGENVGIASLARLDFQVDTHRVTVRNAVAFIHLPRKRRSLRFDINDVEYVGGRVNRLGRVTMSASLAQPSDSAPVSLHLNTGSGEDSSVADTDFSFTNVDLENLELIRILGLPLRKLTGRCSGSLSLRLDNHGVVDRFVAKLQIANLNVQPLKGHTLAEVAHAGLDIEAAYDPLTGRLDVQKAKVLLPGLDLRGRATINTSIDDGNQQHDNWQAIKFLELTDSTIHPSRVAALLTGSAESLGQFAFSGPIKLRKLTFSHEGPSVSLAAAVEATVASICHGNNVIKPTGRNLAVNLDCDFDQRSTDLIVKGFKLRLGENTLIGRGLVPDSPEVARRLSEMSEPARATEILAILSQLDLHGTWEIIETASLFDAIPSAGVLEDINFSGRAGGKWFIRPATAVVVRLLAVLPAKTHLSIGEIFRKPPDTQIKLDVLGSIDPSASAVSGIDMDLSVGSGRLKLYDGRISLTGKNDADVEVTGTFGAGQIQDLLACMGRGGEFASKLRGGFDKCQLQSKFRDSMMDVRMKLSGLDMPLEQTAVIPAGKFTGAMAVAVRVERRKKATRIKIDLNAKPLQYVSTAVAGATKRAGVPAAAKIIAEISGDVANVNSLKLSLGKSFVELGGKISVRKKLAPPDMFGPYDIRVNKMRYILGGAMDSLVPQLKTLCKKHTASGVLQGQAKLTGAGSAAVMELNLDATNVAIANTGGFAKPTGIPTKLELHVEIGKGDRPGRVNVRKLHLAVGDVVVQADGLVDMVPARLVTLNVKAQTKRLDTLDTLIPKLKDFVPAGQASIEARWSKFDGGRIGRLISASNGLALRYRGKDVKLRGSVTAWNIDPNNNFFPDRFSTDDFHARIGKNNLHVIADLHNLDNKPAGTFYLLGDYLDTQDISNWLQTSKDQNPPTGKLSEKDARDLQAQAQKIIDKSRKYLLSANLSGRANLRKFITYDSAVKQSYTLGHFNLTTSIVRGTGRIKYSAAINGGSISTEYDVHFVDAAPFVTIVNNVRDVAATKNIQPQLAMFFPGNTVYGYFNRSQEVTLPLGDLIANAIDRRYRLKPVGKAKTVTIDGMVEGRGAPKFVTRFLPGLNLTKYKYKKMTGFAKLRKDGSVYNDMVFDGHRYDVFMEGVTDSKNIGRYTVGVILLGTPQSAEWNHTYRQGRIPLLKSKARIADRKMHDVKVSYPWPTETLFSIFLKNNIFYRIWLKKQRK